MGPALIAHWSVADINWTTELVWLQDSLTFQCKSQNFLPIFFFLFLLSIACILSGCDLIYLRNGWCSNIIEWSRNSFLRALQCTAEKIGLLCRVCPHLADCQLGFFFRISSCVKYSELNTVQISVSSIPVLDKKCSLLTKCLEHFSQHLNQSCRCLSIEISVFTHLLNYI